MTKEDLISYFSYYLKEGRNKIDLRNEALKQGYTNKEISGAFSAIFNNKKARTSTKRSDKWKIITLSVLIIIIMLAIVVILILNLGDNHKKIINSKEKFEENDYEEIEISTLIFNESSILISDGPMDFSNQSAIDSYFIRNPIEKTNLKELNDNFRNCINTKAHFSGGDKELDGYFNIKYLDEDNCLISYSSDFTLDCNFSKDILKSDKDFSNNITGVPIFYSTISVLVKLRVIIESYGWDANKSYGEWRKSYNPDEKNSKDLMVEVNLGRFYNPKTNNVEIIKCWLYETP